MTTGDYTDYLSQAASGQPISTSIPGMPTAGAGQIYSSGQIAQSIFFSGPVMSVYLGDHKLRLYGAGAIDPTDPSQGKKPTSRLLRHVTDERSNDDMMTAFDKMDREHQRELARQLALAGLINIPGDDLSKLDETVNTTPLDTVRSAYGNLIQDAASRYAAGQTITPDEILDQKIKYRLLNAGIDDIDKLKQHKEPADGSVKTEVSKQTSVSFLNPEDAKGLTRQMLQQQLGRDPSQAEYEDFLSMLHAAERAHPSTSTTTSSMTYDAETGGYVNPVSHTTTQQGIGADGLNQMAYERATQNPDWAEWQAVGTYAPALFAALGSPVPGV